MLIRSFVNFRVYTLFLVPILLVNAVAAQSNKVEERTVIEKIEKFLRAEFKSDSPGAAVLISKGDSIIYRNAFGLSNMEKGIVVETDMIFQIASMSKQFTAVAILQLVEKGRLSLDDTVQRYVDYFPFKGHPISIEHLLTHTSGIPEFFDIDEDEYHLLVQQHTPATLISYFAKEPLEFEPGSKFRYSNSNYVLLGAIIEKASGLTYGQYIQENLFKPLGMNNTALWYQDSFDDQQISLGYMIKDDKYVVSTPIGGSILYSSGGIVSTLDDLFIWNRALKNNRMISTESASKMFASKTLTSGQSYEYGYGVFVKRLQGQKTIQHGGNLYGFTSSGLWLMDEDVFVCILANRGFARTEEIADYIASLLIGQPIEITIRKEIKSVKLNEYIGRYKLDAKKSNLMDVILVSDKLVLTFPNQPGSEAMILPTGKEDLFESKKINATLRFIRDDFGKVTGIEVKQGKSYHWVKTR